MADHTDDGDNNDVFIYMGGSVPQHLRETITHVRVHKSVKIVPFRAFQGCNRLVSIEMHDGVEIIEREAFYDCTSLGGIKLAGVRVIGDYVFWSCDSMTDVEFGDELETIGRAAFEYTPVRIVTLPKVRNIGSSAFDACVELMEVKLSKDLETIGSGAFWSCHRLRRIAIPLKENLLGARVFKDCENLTQVDLVGGTHKTISSLLLESWSSEMNKEIDRINQLLPNTPTNEKTAAITQWMERALRRIDHYKVEHRKLLKEFTTLLELALWKVKLDEKEEVENTLEIQKTKKAKIDDDAARQELRITSGANIVIKNVLPFLVLE